MSDVAEYLIQKHGIFYRPDARGYTIFKRDAGRYTLKQAINHTHPNGPDGPRDGMVYIHQDEVPDDNMLAARGDQS